MQRIVGKRLVDNSISHHGLLALLFAVFVVFFRLTLTAKVGTWSIKNSAMDETGILRAILAPMPLVDFASLDVCHDDLFILFGHTVLTNSFNSRKTFAHFCEFFGSVDILFKQFTG